MSTRGYIAIQFPDGICKGFYNHFDNYPEGTGLTLLSTPGCATGDLDVIQKALQNEEKDWVFTHMNWQDARSEGERHGCDWFYLRKGDTWYCSCYYGDKLFLDPVAEVLVRDIRQQYEEDE